VENTALPFTGFWAEHGISFLVEGEGGKLLFDTGQSNEVLAHNLLMCKEDLSDLDAVVLSHGHLDHGGGLAEVARRCPGVPLYAHPDALANKHARHGDKIERIGLPLDRQELESFFSLKLLKKPVEVIPGVWTTGEVERRSAFEHVAEGLFVKEGDSIEPNEPEGLLVKEGDSLKPDELKDDLSMVLETPGGPVVLLGCCHAGLVNTLWQIRKRQNANPRAILGGAHLFRATPARLKQTAKVLEGLNLEMLSLGHCTGVESVFYLREKLGEIVVPLYSGGSREF